MPVHNAMTGSELHEAKGAAAATTGQILTATGSGGAVFVKPLLKAVFVNAVSDLPTPSAGKHLLAANTSYLLGADINIGTNFLQFSAGTSLQGLAAFVASITYTGTVPMLQGADGNATIKDLTLICASSEVYNWVDTGGGGNSIVIITDVLVVACTSIGTFDDINTLVIDGSTIVSCTDGIIILGNSMTGLRVMSVNMLSTDANFVGFDFTGSLVATVNLEGIIFTGGASSIGIKGDAGSANIVANDIANVSNVQFLGVNTALSGIAIDDFRWNFQGNGDVADTMPDALVSMINNATVTTLSVGVPTLVAGTWIVNRASQFTATTGGRATYNGERDLVTPIDVSVVIDPASGTNKTFRCFVAVNGVAVADSGIAVNISAGDPKQISVPWQANISNGDFIEVFIENETDSVDATVIDATVRVR